MIVTNGLNHLALPVRDPERSARFYAEHFNMEIVMCTPDVALVSTVGSTDIISFSRSDTKIVSGRKTMHFGFSVEPEQFDEALRTIEEKAIKKVSEAGNRNKVRFIYIEDPDGYAVEIFTRPSPCDD